MKKRIISAAMAVALAAVSLAACGGSSTTSTTAAPAAAPAATEAAATEAAAPAAEAPADAEYVIKVGHTSNTDVPCHIGFMKFEEEVEKNSNGRIDVQIYPNSELGTERAMYEACQMGTLEVAYGTSSVLANFYEPLIVLDLPFLFSDVNAARKAMNGDLGKAATEGIDSTGMYVLGFMENGIRHTTNSKRPINTPEDFKGIKIRTMENEIHMSAFSKMGASPTPMAFTELFTALQQKTVDGQENPLYLIQSSKFYEVQNYLSLTGHVYTTGIATINKNFWDSLPEDLQKVVNDAFAAGQEAEYAACDEQNVTALEFLKTQLEVNEITPENRQLFIDACAETYNEVEAKVGKELMDVARAAQAQ